MSKRYGRFVAAIVEGLTAPQKPWRRANTRLMIANALQQRHVTQTPRGPLTFVTTHPEALQFPRELVQREPETIAWIDSFETPCRFWDVGANVGTYSLYAALQPGVSVTAFEPSPATYAAMSRNIEANGRDDRIQAYCVALNAETRLGSLNMTATHAGTSFNSFESEEDCFGHKLDVTFRQPMIGFSVDDFRRVFRAPAPHYLKIDVDGVEEQILSGAAETLADPTLRAVLIELETEETDRNERIVAPLHRAGFALSSRGDNHAGSANAIFTRC